jgi:hypothetical protein
MNWGLWVVGAIGLGIVAYGTYLRWIDPPKVVSASRIEMTDPKSGGKVSFPTRKVQGGGIVTEQVQLPGGTWIDCDGDCREAVRKTTTDFWDEQQRRRK